MTNKGDDVRIIAVLPGMWARGAEICTLNLLTGLKQEGYENLHFHAALRQAIPADMELHLEERFKAVAEVSYGIHGDRNGVNENLVVALHDAQPDVLLYAFDKSIPGYYTRAKSVLVVHGIAENDFAGYHPKYTDAVVCVSRFAFDIALGHGIPKKKLHVIPNGVPQVEGVDRRADWGIPDDAWVWCFVGGLTRLKRPEILIAALARRNNDECAIFAGHPDESMMLKGYAEALGVLDRCVFLGHTDDIGDVYRSSDALVITSERESMPLIILEAMSVGLGTVANSVGGIPEVLVGKNGILCEVWREKDFDRALDEMRGSAKKIVSLACLVIWNDFFSLDIMTRRYDNLFRQLLEGRDDN
jgi:glycosyltransferase involved in cell wall biosynthesis